MTKRSKKREKKKDYIVNPGSYNREKMKILSNTSVLIYK